MRDKNILNAIDMFSGCGGLTEGLKQAGFNVIAAIDNNSSAVSGYKLNHPLTEVLNNDVRKITVDEIGEILGNKKIHLLVGCPPCQGFSSLRRLNKKHSIRDPRNSLILEYLRFIKGLKPVTIMMENVPGLMNYYLFKQTIKVLKSIGYYLSFDILNMKDFGVPQNRKRLILIGSLLSKIEIIKGTGEKKTVRDVIGDLEHTSMSKDPLHVYKDGKRTARIKKMISLIPKNGGSRKDLPEEYELACHKNNNVGFNDIYGRLRWDDFSSTITGGCLNPSKGRFLHPEFNRNITPREAALLQSFPLNYKFPLDMSKRLLANIIGEALPPKFSYIQALNIRQHLNKHFAG